jgi:hypothetical protein
MGPIELSAALASLEPLDGLPPAWVAELNAAGLVEAARWIRTRLVRLEQEAALTALRGQIAAAGEREGEGALLRPLFDEARRVLSGPVSPTQAERWAAMVHDAEAAPSLILKVSAWLTTLQDISAASSLSYPSAPLPDRIDAPTDAIPGGSAAPALLKPRIELERLRGRRLTVRWPAGQAQSRFHELSEPRSPNPEQSGNRPSATTGGPGERVPSKAWIAGRPLDRQFTLRWPAGPTRPLSSSASESLRPGPVQNEAPAQIKTPTGAPTVPLIDRCRELVRAGFERIPKAVEVSHGCWGIDFGTAWSKSAFRSERGGVSEGAETTLSHPSIVAVERRGDRILFGARAAQPELRADEWNISTSMKRFLVGKKIEISGLPKEMTTERLTALYIAWLIHRNDSIVDSSRSPCKLPVHISVPLMGVGLEPELRTFFPGGILERREGYRAWVQRALRMAQLIAVTYHGREWPESVSELLTVLRLWDAYRWQDIQRRFEVVSEPAAIIGDFDPTSLDEGLTMLVDCGAGTTDVSVFWRRSNGIFVICETSRVVGGDTLDAEIVQAVLRESPQLSQYAGSIAKWAREAKPALLGDGAIDFDPELVLNVEGAFAMTIRLETIKQGIADLRRGIEAVVSSAIVKADSELASLRPGGTKTWPSVRSGYLKHVWYTGGTSAFEGVEDAIQSALIERKVSCKPRRIGLPTSYTGWSVDRYRTMACAVGASRFDLQRPSALPPDTIPILGGLSPWDKDAG